MIRARTYWALLRARATTHRALRAINPERILVVCYGNIYRSPFVDRLLAAHLDPDTVTVRSAGFHAVANRPSPPRHIQSCRAYGVDLTDHRSRTIGPEDVSWADIIVLMDRHNWASLVRLGAPPQRLIWLGALLPHGVEIADPYGMTDQAAAATVAKLNDAASELARVLIRPRVEN